jgi:hypothetical protein
MYFIFGLNTPWLATFVIPVKLVPAGSKQGTGLPAVGRYPDVVPAKAGNQRIQ